MGCTQMISRLRNQARFHKWFPKLVVYFLVFTLLLASAPVAQANDNPPRVHPALLKMAAEHPNDTFMVIIQRDIKNKELKDELPEIAVEKAGGKVKKQLPMIESFSAELTGKEIEKLAKNPKIRWVSLDAPLVSTAVGDPTVRDEFTTVSYSNNNGTQSWANSWTESGDDGSPATGYVNAYNGSLILENVNRSISRQANLVGATSATLSFLYSRGLLDDVNDYVAVQVSANGGSSWTELARYVGPANDTAWQSASFNILNYATATTQIRFVTSASLGSADYIYIDDLQIEYTQSTVASLATGLVGYWNFDANANDFSSNNYNGTLTNGALINTTSGTNKIGSGKLSLDGNNDYVDLSSHRANIAALAQGTIAMWIKTTSTSDELFSLSDNADLDSVAALWINNSGKISFDVWENNSSLLIANSVASVNDGQWHHVVATVNATGNKLYIDGNQAAVSYSVGNASNTAFFDDVTGIDVLGIGRNVNSAGGRMYYNGLMDDVRLYNRALSAAEIGLLAAATPIPANVNGSIRATALRQQLPALTGQGIGVAVVDSGIAAHTDLQGRLVANNNQTATGTTNDTYTHGTHVAGIIGGNGSSSAGVYAGVGPGVNLINVKVSDGNGVAITSDLIDGLQWILNNKTTYNIKVVNISLNSTVPEPYHTSALCAAVEILWFNGITVVVAAGNNGNGNNAVTLYPPANDPFVITVGAAEDKGTTSLSDDTMALFSAYGTTENGYAKPDLVAPGRNLISLLASTTASGYLNHPAHRVNNSYFRMSGTSMAAPVVSGAVALLLQDEPGLTPDQVKYRLRATANSSWTNYSSSKAGAGYLDIYAAVYGTTTQSANTGLAVSNMLTTGSNAVNSSVNWNSVNWNSVNWNSVNWNSVNWNSVNWNSGNWSNSVWDDATVNAATVLDVPTEVSTDSQADSPAQGDALTHGEADSQETREDEVASSQQNLFLPLVVSQ